MRIGSGQMNCIKNSNLTSISYPIKLEFEFQTRKKKKKKNGLEVQCYERLYISLEIVSYYSASELNSS